ncbi:MAG: hypothetical protein LUE19_01820, partial [Clostridiales bacterium]|nr:hypothetical protein [Clostridiales bacterium]
LTAGSVLLLSGCGVDLTAINTADTDISAELETENLSDGTILVHSVWYSSDESSLSGAVITLSSDDGELFSGTTDDSGCLEECTLPGNTTITCEITDSTGELLAEAEIVFKLSSDYSDLTIYNTSDSEAENSQCILEIPTEKTDIRAAIFVTEDGGLSFANLTPYTESDDETDDAADSEDEAASDDTADGSESADTQETSDGETASEGDSTTTGDGTADGGDGTATEGDTADGGDGTTDGGDTADGGDGTATEGDTTTEADTAGEGTAAE